jgi:hypothetical protein
MYAEQSGQDFGGGAGVVTTSTTPPQHSEPGQKTRKQAS